MRSSILNTKQRDGISRRRVHGSVTDQKETGRKGMAGPRRNILKFQEREDTCRKSKITDPIEWVAAY